LEKTSAADEMRGEAIAQLSLMTFGPLPTVFS
jgi:hypothetical protein